MVAQPLSDLRARIREIEGNRVSQRVLPSGFQGIDQVIGGLPRPGLVEIVGSAGSGRTRLALALATRALQVDAPIAWFDPERRVYPPGLQALGVPNERVLLVRPSSDRVVWAVEQALRAGCFEIVIVSDPAVGARDGVRWQRAAEAGGATALVLRERAGREVPAALRLRVSRDTFCVAPGGAAPGGGEGTLPARPAEGDPW